MNKSNVDCDFIQKALQTYADMVVRIAFQNLRNQADAEDVLQEVFIRLLCSDTAFENDEHLKAWLIRVTINRCRDIARSAWLRKTVELNEACDYAFDEEDRRLWDDLRTLPPPYRNILYLYYFEGYALHEIAELTGESINTVNSRLQRARKKLKLVLEGGLSDEPKCLSQNDR